MMLAKKYKRKNCQVKRFQMDYFKIQISKIELFISEDSEKGVLLHLV